MKSSTKILAIAALALSLGIAEPANAQEIEAQIETSASVQISPSSTPRPADIRAQIELRKNQAEHPLERRIEMRKDMRKEMQEDNREARVEVRTEMRAKIASTTMMFKRERKEAQVEMKKKMEARQFEIRKTALERELTRALENLTDISGRIQARIEKAESEGRDMTEARTLLVTAQAQLEKARANVDVLVNLNPTAATTGTASASAEIDLAKPRQIGDSAIKSLKETRDALQKVVIEIAHNMGMKVGATASTTAN